MSVDAAVSPRRKARVTDPSTSHRAALAAYPRAGSQRERILRAIAESLAGLTYDEATLATGIVGVSTSTRISELAVGGWIERAGERTTSAGGTAVVWKATAKALAALSKPEGTPTDDDQAHPSGYESVPGVGEHAVTGSASTDGEPVRLAAQPSLFDVPARPAWA